MILLFLMAWVLAPLLVISVMAGLVTVGLLLWDRAHEAREAWQLHFASRATLEEIEEFLESQS